MKMQFKNLFFLLLLGPFVQGSEHGGEHGGEHGNGAPVAEGANKFDVPNTFSAAWSVDLEKSEITYTMIGATSGYVSLGWAKGNAAHARNSDIVVGWVNNDGTVVAYQTTGTGNTDRPTTRNQQTITNISGSKTGDSTTISFTRPLDPADGNDVNLRDPDTLMVWGIGTSPGSGNSINSYTFSQHSSFGGQRANLLSANPVTLSNDGVPVVQLQTQENQNGNSPGSIDGTYIVWSLIGGAFIVVFGGAYFYQKNRNYKSQQHRESMKAGHLQNTSAFSSSNPNVDQPQNNISST